MKTYAKTNNTLEDALGTQVVVDIDLSTETEMYPKTLWIKKRLKEKSWARKESLPLSLFFETNEDGEIEGKFGFGSEINRRQGRKDKIVCPDKVAKFYGLMISHKSYGEMEEGIVIDFGENWEQYPDSYRITSRYRLDDCNHTLALALAIGRTEHVHRIVDFEKDLDCDINATNNLSEWANDNKVVEKFPNPPNLWKAILLEHMESSNPIWGEDSQFGPKTDDNVTRYLRHFIKCRPKDFSSLDSPMTACRNVISRWGKGGKRNTDNLLVYRENVPLKRKEVMNIKRLEDKNGDLMFEGFKPLETRTLGGSQTGKAETFDAIVEGHRKILLSFYLTENGQIDKLDSLADNIKKDCDKQMAGINRLIRNVYDEGFAQGSLVGGSRDLYKSHSVSITPQILRYTYSDNVEETKRLEKINKRLRK